MSKRTRALYDHNARPVNTRTFGISSAGAPSVSTSHVNLRPALPRPATPEYHEGYNEDIPVDIDEDFEMMDPSDQDNDGGDLDIDEEVPRLPEVIAPDLNIRQIQKPKRYENSASYFIICVLFCYH